MDGMFRFGGFWRFRLGLASCGSVRYGGRGSVRFGRVGCGQSRRSWFGLACLVRVRLGLVAFVAANTVGDHADFPPI